MTSVTDEEVLIESVTTGVLPVDVVWSHLLDIEFRQILTGADRVELHNTRKGRAGEGAEYRCWHGSRETTQLIVGWKPLERIVTRDTTKMGGATFTFQADYLLEQVPEGTRIAQRASVYDGPSVATALMKRLFPRLMRAEFQRHIDAFGEAIEQAYEKRLATADAGL